MTLRFELNTSLLGVGFGPSSKSTAGIVLCDMGSVGRSASRVLVAVLFCLKGAATKNKPRVVLNKGLWFP